MSARALTAALVALALAPAGAAAATQSVTAGLADFTPSQVDALPGDSVQWTNGSPRVHTVTFETGQLGTDDLEPDAVFTQRFEMAGAYAYRCTIHPQMTGEVDVRRVLLDVLPTAVVPSGQRVEVTGRAVDPAHPVSVQRSLGGGAFATVATTSPAPDGSWRTTITADGTADVRALSGGDVSQTRRLLVSERRVRVRATRRGVVVTVTPAVPYARIMLQADLHERFGWWPIARAKLDYLSQASFKVRRPARVRAVLVAKDGWTPLATSPVVVLGHVKPTHMGDGGGMHMHAVARRLS